MFSQGTSQFLNNYNNQQLNNQLTLDNQLVNKILSNNILSQKSLKNKMNNGNSLFNINNNFPQLQYQNQKNNINFQQQIYESNLIDLIKNLSLEPSNLNINNLSSLNQSLLGINTPIGIGNALNQQSQNGWAGNLQNNNNLLLQKALLLQLLNNN